MPLAENPANPPKILMPQKEPATTGQTKPSQHRQTKKPETNRSEVDPPLDHDKDQLRVFVRIEAGRTLTIKTNTNLHTAELKLKIQQQTRLPMEAIRLIHNGKQLRETDTLGDHNITDGATVHVILSLRGGASKETEYMYDGCSERQAMEFDPSKIRIGFMGTDGITSNAQERNMVWERFAGVSKEHNISSWGLADSRTNKDNVASLRHTLNRALQTAHAVRYAPSKLKSRQHIGGVTSINSGWLNARVANDRKGKPAILHDSRGHGRYTITKYLGKKKPGDPSARTMVVITVYSPIDTYANESATDAKVQDATTLLLKDIQDSLDTIGVRGSSIIIVGDLNSSPFATGLTQTTEKAKRSKQWEKFARHLGLVNAFGKLHKKNTVTYRLGGGAAWLDHALVSNHLISSGAVTMVATMSSLGRQDDAKGLLNSSHIPSFIEIDPNIALGCSPNGDSAEGIRPTPGGPRIKMENKAQVELYRSALEKQRITFEGEEHTWGQLWTAVNRELTAVVRSKAKNIPSKIQTLMDTCVEKLIEANLSLFSKNRQKHNTKPQNHKWIWSREAHNRRYCLQKAKHLLKNKRLIMSDHLTRRALSVKLLKTLKQNGFRPPKSTPPETQKEWMEWRVELAKWSSKLSKKQHSKCRLTANKERNKHSKRMAACMEKGITRRYVNFALRRAPNPPMPTAFVKHSEEGAKIIAGETDIKQTMVEIGKRDLSVRQDLWFRAGTDTTDDHPLSRDDDIGGSFRERMAFGTDIDRSKGKASVPARYGRFIDELKRKTSTQKHTRSTASTISQTEMKYTVNRKKGNTPGSDKFHLNFLKAATEETFAVFRLLCSFAIITSTPFESWKTEIYCPTPKTNPPDVDRLRPLKLLQVLRKITSSIVIDRVQAKTRVEGTISEEAYGFVKGKKITTAALVRRLVCEHAMREKEDVYVMDVDLSKAYDKTLRWVLDCAMLRVGIEKSTREYFLNLARTNRNFIRTAFGLTEEFHAEAAALPQGDTASPFLFVLVTDWLISITKEDSKHPYKYTNEQATTDITQTWFADDSSWFQSDKEGIEHLAQLIQDFADFTGMEMNTNKSFVIGIEWDEHGRRKDTTYDPIAVTSRSNAIQLGKTENIEETETREAQKWSVTTKEQKNIPWKQATEHIRHLGNIQSNTGKCTNLLKKLEEEIHEACHVLDRRMIRKMGALAISKTVLGPKAKYALVLSNATVAEIDALQRTVTTTLCHKFNIARNTKHDALFGRFCTTGWERWSDMIMECKLKITAEALQTPDSLMGKLMRASINSLQNDHGGSTPVLKTAEANETVGHAKNQKEWLWTVWEWMGQNNIKIEHETPKLQPRRVNDYLLIDRSDPAQRKDIRRRLDIAKWASDIHDESGEHAELSHPLDTDKKWMAAAAETCHWSSIPEPHFGKRNTKGETETRMASTRAPSVTEFKLGPWISRETLHKWSSSLCGTTIFERLGRKRYATYTIDEVDGPHVKDETEISRNPGPASCSVTRVHSKGKALETEIRFAEQWTLGATEVEEHQHTWAAKLAQTTHTNTKKWRENHYNQCEACDKPGTIILCDYCHDGYHRQCLKEAIDTTFNEVWACPKCEKEGREKTKERNEVTRPNEDAHLMLLEAKTKNHTLRGYSDGSMIHNAGSYGWIVGFYEKGTFHEIARGWGVEHERDNLTNRISTSRMEALGLLRMWEYLTKEKWRGKTLSQLDNETVANRADRWHDRPNAYWSAPDYDIWHEIRKIKKQGWKAQWVRSHPEWKKKKSKDPKLAKFFVSVDYVFTPDENQNMVADKIAGEAYGERGTVGEKQWYSIADLPGTVTVNDNIVTGNAGRTIRKCIQAEHSRKWARSFWETEHNWWLETPEEAESNWLMCHDEKLQLDNESASKVGQVRTMKIAHGLLATNARLKTQERTTLARCTCCHNQPETLNHLMGHCPDKELTDIRKRLIQKLHTTIDNMCKSTKVRPRLKEQLKELYTLESMKHAHEETNSRSMMGGTEEGQRWVGIETALKVNPSVEAGGWLIGTITKFDPDQPMLDQTWTVKWEGNDKTIEYDYRGIKEIVPERKWVPQTRLSNASPGQTIVDKVEQCEIQSLTKGGLNAIWKGMLPNAWMKVLCTGGVDARTAKSQTRKLRDTLLEGQHDIWKARNDRKHNKIITPGSTEDKEIDQIFRVIRKLRLDLHGTTPEEIKKRPTKAREAWKIRQGKRAKAALAQMKIETKKEENRVAHLKQRKQNNEHMTQITQTKTKQSKITDLREGNKTTPKTKPKTTHNESEDKGGKHQHKKARTIAQPQNTDTTEDKMTNTITTKEQPQTAKESDAKTQQEQEQERRWDRAKKIHLRKYKKVLGYRKTETDRGGKRHKKNGGDKGGKQSTRTKEDNRRRKAEGLGEESTRNDELERNRRKTSRDKRSSSIEDNEVREKQTGPIPKEPD